MANEYELTFQDYWSILRRRAPYLIGIFVVVLLLAIIITLTITPTYRATGTIMVESQQISNSIVPDAIKIQLDEQLNIIKQRVLTRENLVQIANQYKLFKEKIGPLAPAELIDKIRERIVIETGNSKEPVRNSRQDQQAIAFTLSFDAPQPEVALQVTNDLISLFLDWNVKLRTGETTETTAFFTQEANKLKLEVDRLEQSIAEYKQKHRSGLPENLTLRATMLTRADNDLREIERDYRVTQDELRSLEIELTGSRHGIGEENAFQSLPALKSELARLLTIYNESHPDVKRIKRKIELLEKTKGVRDIAAPGSPTSRIEAKIDSDKARLVSLARQSEMLRSKISENEYAMTSTPKVEQGLDALIRDRDSAQKKYEEIRNKQMNAKIAESLESGNKSGRFSILEAPLLPEKPFKPDRIKILALGFLLAIASSGGAMLLLESIDKRVRGIEALTHVLGYRPMVVIPYIPAKEDEVHRKRMLRIAIMSAVTAMLAALLVLHFL